MAASLYHYEHLVGHRKNCNLDDEFTKTSTFVLLIKDHLTTELNLASG